MSQSRIPSKVLLLLFCSFALLLFSSPPVVSAGTPIGNFSGIGPVGNVIGKSWFDVIPSFVGVISRIIGVLTVAGGIWFIFQIFLGAINWLSSSGDKQQLDNAKKRLTNAIIGLIVVVLAYALIGIIGAFVGLNIFNMANLIYCLVPGSVIPCP